MIGFSMPFHYVGWSPAGTHRAKEKPARQRAFFAKRVDPIRSGCRRGLIALLVLEHVRRGAAGRVQEPILVGLTEELVAGRVVVNRGRIQLVRTVQPARQAAEEMANACVIRRIRSDPLALEGGESRQIVVEIAAAADKDIVAIAAAQDVRAEAAEEQIAGTAADEMNVAGAAEEDIARRAAAGVEDVIAVVDKQNGRIANKVSPVADARVVEANRVVARLPIHDDRRRPIGAEEYAVDDDSPI